MGKEENNRTSYCFSGFTFFVGDIFYSHFSDLPVLQQQ